MSFNSSSFPYLSPNCCSVSNSIVCNFLHLTTSCIWQRSHMRYTVHRPRQFQQCPLFFLARRHWTIPNFWHGAVNFNWSNWQSATTCDSRISAPVRVIRDCVLPTVIAVSTGFLMSWSTALQMVSQLASYCDSMTRQDQLATYTHLPSSQCASFVSLAA